MSARHARFEWLWQRQLAERGESAGAGRRDCADRQPAGRGAGGGRGGIAGRRRDCQWASAMGERVRQREERRRFGDGNHIGERDGEWRGHNTRGGGCGWQPSLHDDHGNAGDHRWRADGAGRDNELGQRKTRPCWYRRSTSRNLR